MKNKQYFDKKSSLNSNNELVQINLQQEYSWDDFTIKDTLESQNIVVNYSTTPGEASQEKCKKIMNYLCQISKGDPSQVLVITAALLQKGATSPKAPDAQKVSLSTTTISIGDIRKACKKENVTVRQFARGIKDKVVDVMLQLGDRGVKGNLAKLAEIDLPNLTNTDLIWASDFQTYNPRCPEKIRNWLLSNYSNRFKK